MTGKLIIPDIQTDRLMLTALSPVHEAGMFALWSNPDVCRHSGPITDYDGKAIPSPMRTIDDSNRLIDFWLRAADAGWGFRWALISRETGAFMGATGFNALGPCSGYACHLHPDYWGQGLMSEASLAAIDWRLQPGSCADICTSLDAEIAPDNTASIKLAERLGLRATDEYIDGHRRYVRMIGD